MKHLLSIRDLTAADIDAILAASGAARAARAARTRASRSISRSRARAPATRWKWRRRSSAAIRSTSRRTSSASGRARAFPTSPTRLPAIMRSSPARVFDHGLLEEMARVNAAPVLNMLSGTDHPLQALADLLTVKQLLGKVEGREDRLHRRGQQCLALACRSLRARRRRVHHRQPRGLRPRQCARRPAGRRPTPKPPRARTSSTPTCGCRWAARRARSGARRSSRYQVDEALMEVAPKRPLPALPARPARRGSDRCR